MMIDQVDDRLSELPEHLLRRILCFVDSKTTVRTSLLSRRWRSVWKGVPALNLNLNSFHSFPTFTQFISHILSRRYGSAVVEEITLDMGPVSSATIEARSMYETLFYATFRTLATLLRYVLSGQDRAGRPVR
ncbi:unnamed protein product [Linum tenue]|uniref:F-box domain-containing protein n=1 Tax=Linum tenue TaxID=586396 RepID=A0AAV0JTU5_9ROSI|nr:unnamed protein product [Linum tenue]